MIPAVKSELLKFFSTRLWWGMAISIFLAAALFAFLFGIVYTLDSSGDPQMGQTFGDPTRVANSVYTAGLGVGYLLLLTIGVMQIGAEYRHKTITSTFLSIPRRGRAMLAKVIALMVLGVIYGLISLAGSVSVGAVTLMVRGEDAFPSAEIARTLALSLLVLGLWALIGLGLGILIPNQVAALIIGIGVAWIVEPLAGFLLNFWEFGREYIAPYLPGQATNSIVQGVATAPDQVQLDWWVAALVLAAWAALLSGIGILRALRQDVS